VPTKDKGKKKLYHRGRWGAPSKQDLHREEARRFTKKKVSLTS